MEDIKVLGPRSVVFKSERKHPVKVQSELVARRPEVRMDSSPTYQSVALGKVENALQRVIRLTGCAVGRSEAKQAMEPNTRVMTFVVNQAATITNRFSVHQDGKTPMKKARGTTANREMAEVRGENTVPAHDEVQKGTKST